MWCITNICTGNEDQVQAIIKKDGIAVLKKVLNSPYQPNRSQAIWALGNIASDNFLFRNLVLREGVLSHIISIIDHEKDYQILKSCTWCLANLCRGKPLPALEYMLPAIEPLSCLIKAQNNTNLLIDCVWTLYHISEEAEESLDRIIETGVIPRLVTLLKHEDVKVALPCLRVLGNVTTGTDEQTQAVIDAGALVVLKDLMQGENKSLRKESSWVTSNIAAGTPAQLAILLVVDVLPIACKLVIEDDYEVKKEALWVVTNVTEKMTPENVDYVLKSGTVKAFTSMLTTTDVRLLSVVLRGLESLLKNAEQVTHDGRNPVVTQIEEINSVNAIENLQFHENQAIYNSANNILEKYFNLEDCDEILIGGDVEHVEPVTIFNFWDYA